MKQWYLLILTLLIFTSIQAQEQRIVANPIDLNYRFQPDEPSRREAADPVCEYFKDKYYLFASKSGGYWSSPDLATWTYIACTSIPVQENYAPTILPLGDRLYYFTGSSTRIFYTETPENGGSWKELSPARFEYSVTDPAFFRDEDSGKVYMYWGCSDIDPIKGVEIDPNNGFKSIGTPKTLIAHHGEKYGWEVPGKNNEEKRTGWNEGAAMLKYNGKYYLQYAAPGTEYRIYADGVYVGDSPLGPFTYMESSPFSIKPGGFIGGAGHGHTFKDKYGNYWHVSTMRISKRHSFERRLGLFPAYFKDGALYSHTVWTDYPFKIPDEKADFSTSDCSLNWQLLSYGKPATASSTYSVNYPRYANNEEIENWWSAQTGNAGEWWQVELNGNEQINAIQVNFADQDFTNKASNSYVYYQYYIEASNDGENWQIIVDRKQNTLDKPHELIVLDEPQTAKYLRITNSKALNGKFSISGFRVFGHGKGEAPQEVTNVQANRKFSDQRRFTFTWDKQENTTGYILHWGISENQLNNAAMVFTNRLEAGFFNRDSEYYFSVDAFNENGITRGTTIVKGENYFGSPYEGIVREIPGTIEAEDYNEGGQDCAYYDSTPNNFFLEYRSDDVDIDYYSRNRTYYIANTTTGEYTNYTIEVKKTGLYDFDCTGASVQTGNPGGFYLSFDGEKSTQTAVQTLPAGSRTNWQIVTIKNIPLTEGKHVITFHIQGDILADKFIFHQANTGFHSPTELLPAVYPNPSDGIFQIQSAQPGIFLVSDVFGRNIASVRTSGITETIDLSHYPAGIYILSFSAGNQQHKIKLIKK